MNNATAANRKPIQFFAIVLTLQFILYLALYLNIAVVRQIIGFLYITFVPGFVIIKLLKIDQLDRLENMLFSVGFSIAFLMFTGFVVNAFGPSIGVWAPLETPAIIALISGFVLIGATLYYLRNASNINLHIEKIGIKLRYLIFLILPILSIIGAFWVNIAGNNSILLLLILMIATVFAAGVLSKKFLPSKYYALTIFLIAIALLFHSSLISNYIYGNDLHIEYYLSKLTQNQGTWTTVASYENIGYGRFNDMLSITILPTIYSNILNVETTWILKIVFPFLLSLIPVVLFKIWQESWGKKIAFISAFLLISQITFYNEIVLLARQTIAELFFVLLLFVLFSKKLSSISNKFCLIFFSIALIVSHYAIALIFFFLIFGSWFLMLLIKKKSRKILLVYVMLFAVMMFLWYIFTSAESFESILRFSGYVYAQLGDFFNLSSRGTAVMRGLGVESAQSYWHAVSRAFAYVIQLFIIIGYFSSVINRKKLKIDHDYLFLLSLGFGLLVLTILLPGFAGTLEMTRFFHIALLLLAPFFVVGYKTCINFLQKKHIFPKKGIMASILLTTILVAYLLFQTNFVYEVAGENSWSIPLSGYRMEKTRLIGWGGCVDEKSVLSSQWLSRNVEVNNTKVYAVYPSWVLLSYGGIYRGNIDYWTNTSAIVGGGVLHLGTFLNYSKLSNQLELMNKAYSNGEWEVWVNSINVVNP
jgi:uncharacterized membrane protein